ncbi:MAG: lytic transglycosylase domain-containing protein [Pseudomonadota bacterium]
MCFVSGTKWAIAQELELAVNQLAVPEICRLIANEARSNGLPPAFFARLIWKESRFDAGAVSPAGALGIAQFMPATAKSRDLKNPFDPKQAIPASARLLAFLRLQMGNLGLAAAAYNAGEGRVDRWLRGRSNLPLETENYVFDITGEPAEVFQARGKFIKDLPLEEGKTFKESCNRLPIIKTGGVAMAQVVLKPWAVQVAGNFKRSIAARKWERIKSRNRSLIEDKPVSISRLRTPIGPRPIYAVRIGADSRSQANALCGQLRARGTACLVARNR